eukprot:TRINITY_DN1042_c0_g2_i11.p1 TRINITY_DN1042_c0_g2~~TRINITY_DN1042_c0_g2_i11.p1  ORF type:complete len:247 (+),score=66.42 TRINITY_DN1042_c0_g2_i11:631-1371(+)
MTEEEADKKYNKWWRTCSSRLLDNQRDFINDMEALGGKLPTTINESVHLNPNFLVEQQAPTELASSFGNTQNINFPIGRGAQVKKLKAQLQELLGARQTRKLQKIVNRKRKKKGVETEEELYKPDADLLKEAQCNKQKAMEDAEVPEAIAQLAGQQQKDIYGIVFPNVQGTRSAKEKLLNNTLANNPTLNLPKRSIQANRKFFNSDNECDPVALDQTADGTIEKEQKKKHKSRKTTKKRKKTKGKK